MRKVELLPTWDCEADYGPEIKQEAPALFPRISYKYIFALAISSNHSLKGAVFSL